MISYRGYGREEKLKFFANLEKLFLFFLPQFESGRAKHINSY